MLHLKKVSLFSSRQKPQFNHVLMYVFYFSDKMGEKHNAWRASRLLAFLVVVSTIVPFIYFFLNLFVCCINIILQTIVTLAVCNVFFSIKLLFNSLI